MRVLVLHSAVAENRASPDELDTLATAGAIAETLRKLGHFAALRPFTISPDAVLSAVRDVRADIVFNMVESALGQDCLASMAPAILERLGIPFTGSGAAGIALAGDKPQSKRILRAAALPTPDWAEPPRWDGLVDDRLYIVKSATEDASIGLDDGAVVAGREAVATRAGDCARQFHGRWFAETYIEGREFNVALLERDNRWEPLPIPEMRFEDWPAGKPQIVGYRAKWDADSEESEKTIRTFGVEAHSTALAQSLSDLATRACALFGLNAYARVDFRVDLSGRPTILEINPNPSLDPEAGFAAAASAGRLSYEALIMHILTAPVRHGGVSPAPRRRKIRIGDRSALRMT